MISFNVRRERLYGLSEFAVLSLLGEIPEPYDSRLVGAAVIDSRLSLQLETEDGRQHTLVWNPTEEGTLLLQKCAATGRIALACTWKGRAEVRLPVKVSVQAAAELFGAAVQLGEELRPARTVAEVSHVRRPRLS